MFFCPQGQIYALNNSLYSFQHDVSHIRNSRVTMMGSISLFEKNHNCDGSCSDNKLKENLLTFTVTCREENGLVHVRQDFISYFYST